MDVVCDFGAGNGELCKLLVGRTDVTKIFALSRTPTAFVRHEKTWQQKAKLNSFLAVRQLLPASVLDRVHPAMRPEKNIWRFFSPANSENVSSRVMTSSYSFFPERWDDETANWKDERGPVPIDWETYRKFQQIKTVSKDDLTGIVTVSFEFRNPELAAKWANDYIAMANEAIRNRAVEESTCALEYLNEKIRQTAIDGLRDTIYRLVEGQLQNTMLANAREGYAFRVVDKALAPEQRSHPNRPLVVLFSLVLGTILGVFSALMIGAWKGAFAVYGGKIQ